MQAPFLTSLPSKQVHASHPPPKQSLIHRAVPVYHNQPSYGAETRVPSPEVHPPHSPPKQSPIPRAVPAVYPYQPSYAAVTKMPPPVDAPKVHKQHPINLETVMELLRLHVILNSILLYPVIILRLIH